MRPEAPSGTSLCQPTSTNFGWSQLHPDVALGQALAHVDSSRVARQEAPCRQLVLGSILSVQLVFRLLLVAEQGWRENRSLCRGGSMFLLWFGCIPPGRPPSISHIRWIPATLQAREQHRTLFHYQPAAWMRHTAFIIFIFSLCLLLAHLLLYRLCTISQEQVARDGGERSLLSAPRGL